MEFGNVGSAFFQSDTDEVRYLTSLDSPHALAAWCVEQLERQTSDSKLSENLALSPDRLHRSHGSYQHIMLLPREQAL